MVDLAWRKSSRSNNNDDSCVELAWSGEALLVRDSKFREGGRLAFGSRGWNAFVDRLPDVAR
jgi:Domain of unknown function (DUF397)